MSRRLILICPATLLLDAGAVGAFAFLRHVCTPHVVTRGFAPDGTELRVVQRWDGGWEFVTEVFYRRPGRPWGRFFYDADDDYWGLGRTEVDTEAKRFSVYRDELLTITFDW
jgi:hypothetical protein